MLAADDRARDACERPAWITHLAHHIDPLHLGARDLTTSPSTRRSAPSTRVEVAELHAPFSHQELILKRELGLADDVAINPSGGALTANPMFSAGLNRIGEAARRVWDGTADAALGHATSGPALQQNLVCAMSSEATA